MSHLRKITAILDYTRVLAPMGSPYCKGELRVWVCRGGEWQAIGKCNDADSTLENLRYYWPHTEFTASKVKPRCANGTRLRG